MASQTGALSGVFLAVAVLAATWALSGACVQLIRRHFILKRYNGPKGSLLLGAAAELAAGQMNRVFTAWSRQYGSVFRLRLLWMQFIVVTDPALVTEAYNTNALDKNTADFRRMDAMMSPQEHACLLTSATNAHWKAVRKGLAPAFSTHHLRAGFKHIQGAGEQLCAMLHAKGPRAVVDMDDALLRESLDVLGWVGFDHDMGALAGGSASQNLAALADAGAVIEKRLINPLHRYMFWSPELRRDNTALARYHAAMQTLLDGIEARPPAAHTIAGHLLRIADPATGQLLSDERLLPEVSVLFMAGMETTGHTASWALFLVSQHPQVEEQIAAELAQHGLLGTAERPARRCISYEDLSKLTYLNAVIKETLRMYPPAGVGVVRINRERDVLLNNQVLVPRGVGIWLPTHALHYSLHN